MKGLSLVIETAAPVVDDVPRQNSYDYDELIRCGHGELFTLFNARLPASGMLMFDRIPVINSDGGQYGKGEVKAEMDVKPDQWFFGCHFVGDPVMPGCLGLDALWQMVGFFLTWSRLPGKGRALGVDEVRFAGEILPHSKLVEYHIEIKRLLKGRLNMGIANGIVTVDGKRVYTTKNLRVGLFASEIQG
ncbi:MAG: bifunctional 3-hydroxydecanoyl-ACP dehydratase/trans-2-decenoyl-ACP isomerase [Alphaproteobacteria bacterium]|nr:bifunctional 3-hydroxydecanoyl-ACP dehydratase/trans-2-decenoyl-ACP isomerase [Alphaproteobacteria bacterium]